MALALKSSNPGQVKYQISPIFWNTTGDFGYGLSTADAASGNGGPSSHSVLDFRVNTGTTENLATFIATLVASNDGTHAIFAADVIDGYPGGPTGAIGFTFDRISTGGHEGVVPLPAALPLFASGASLLGLLGWRRKRKKMARLAA